MCPHRLFRDRPCTRIAGHTGPHVGGFTRTDPTFAAVVALTFTCNRNALDYLLTKGTP